MDAVTEDVHQRTEAAATDGRALLVAAGGRLAALPLSHVDEVMRPLPVERLPSEQTLAEGVALIRGNLVPVLNVQALFGEAAGGGTAGDARRFVTIRVGSRRVALAVSAVLGVHDAERLNLGDVPPLLHEAVPGAVEAVGRLDAQLLVVLETSRLVPEELWSELEAHAIQ